MDDIIAEYRDNPKEIIHKECPECGSNMWPNGIIHEQPPQFEHKCVNCGYIEAFDILYPHI